ncbi:MAG: hypothetical protein RLZZ511_4259 [Cyanobacteriota bacterium]
MEGRSPLCSGIKDKPTEAIEPAPKPKQAASPINPIQRKRGFLGDWGIGRGGIDRGRGAVFADDRAAGTRNIDAWSDASRYTGAGISIKD